MLTNRQDKHFRWSTCSKASVIQKQHSVEVFTRPLPRPEVSGLKSERFFEKIVPGKNFISFLKLFGLLIIVALLARAIAWTGLYQWRRSALKVDTVAGKTSAKVGSGSPFLTFAINLVSLILFMIAGYVIADLLTTEGIILAAFVNRLFGSGEASIGKCRYPNPLRLLNFWGRVGEFLVFSVLCSTD